MSTRNEIANRLLKEIQFSTSGDALQLVCNYQKGVIRLEQRVAEFQTFVDMLLLVNGFEKVGLPTELSPARSNYEDAKLEPGKLGRLLAGDILKKCGETARDFLAGLDELGKQNRVGSVEWNGEACRLKLFRMTADSKRPVLRIVGRTVSLDFEAAVYHEELHRDLMKATKTPVTEIQSKLPRRIRRLLRYMPDCLKESAYVLEGTQIQELTVDNDVRNLDKTTEFVLSWLPLPNIAQLSLPFIPRSRRPSRTQQYLCIDNHVLDGWSNADRRINLFGPARIIWNLTWPVVTVTTIAALVFSLMYGAYLLVYGIYLLVLFLLTRVLPAVLILGLIGVAIWAGIRFRPRRTTTPDEWYNG